MLRNLFGWLTDEQPNEQPEAPARPAAKRTRAKKFTKAKKPTLAELIELYQGPVPKLFICPISQQTMIDPIMLDKHQGHTFDKKPLTQALEYKPGIDPLTNDPFTSSEPNVDRQKQIYDFYISWYEIVCLKREIKELEVSHVVLKLKQNEEEISPEQRAQRIKEMEEQKCNLIKQLKLHLIVELQVFITLVETAVNAEDKNDDEKQAEITEITDDKRKQLNSLRSQFERSHPELFRDVARNNTQRNNFFITRPGTHVPLRGRIIHSRLSDLGMFVAPFNATNNTVANTLANILNSPTSDNANNHISTRLGFRIDEI
jgi:hypothetical protein